MKHIAQIKKALGISGIYAEASGLLSKNSEKGLQIDLLLDRKALLSGTIFDKRLNSDFC
ncbi:MAG: hypothetical protein HC817_05025 [Saprospiraceae bacterium]|nr:hypothetical protein [Saprospiraceae bacterium]